MLFVFVKPIPCQINPINFYVVSFCTLFVISEHDSPYAAQFNINIIELLITGESISIVVILIT